METTTITQEFISRIDDEMRYNASRYNKEGGFQRLQRFSELC